MFDCEVLTIFPGMVEAYVSEGMVGRASSSGMASIRVVNLRDFAPGRHRGTDDAPYGGGAGMVMKPEPVYNALDELRKDGLFRRIIFPSPQGKRFDQRMAEEFSREDRRLTFICGRYEGVDERIVQGLVDDEISLGDFVITGGELAALAIIDASVRLIPGVVGDERSVAIDSFSWGILDYPHYTRPPVYRGMAVPEVLLSGNHAEIDRWRRREALRRTLMRRPDLLAEASLSNIDLEMIKDIKKEEKI